jgi:RHS repeat-associated protein
MTSYTNPYGKTLGYAYDENGNRTTLAYPDGKTITYQYDTANRLTSATDWNIRTTTYTYNNANALTGMTNPNSTTASYTYDTAGRLTALTNRKSDTSVIANYAYTLDQIGNHLSVTQTEPLTPTRTVKNITSAYDDENRLTAAGGITFTYDANGNITNASGTETYTNTFDYTDKLTSTTMSGITTQYGYDGMGNRFSKTANSTTTRYVIDVNRSLPTVIAETDSAGTITAFYVHGNGLISRVLPGGTTYCYHYDSRGSTIALTDATQTIIDAYAYDTFGNINTRTGSTSNPFSYLGRYGIIDDGNGLYNIRARYYDPDIGKFITKDPLTGKDSDTQSLNRYVYAINNPIRLIDVSGLSAREGEVYSNGGTSDYDHAGLVSNEDWLKGIQKVGWGLGNYGAMEALKWATKTVAPEAFGRIGLLYGQAATTAIGFAGVGVNAYVDTYKHPERDNVEAMARFSIDLTLTAITGITSIVGTPAAGLAVGAALSANREDIQDVVMHNPVTDWVGGKLYDWFW